MSRPRPGLALLLALGTWLAASRAQADTPQVVLVREPGGSDAVVDEALTRLRSELQAAGFDVTEVPSAGTSSSGNSTSVTFAIRRAPPGDDVEIWVTDRLTGKTVVRRIALSGNARGNDASLLAIRAAELLRASLLEATVEPKRAPVAPPAPRTPRVSATLERFVGPVEPREQRGLLEGPHFVLGVSGLFSFDGLGASLAPTLRLGVGLYGGLSTRLSLTGPTLTPELSAAAGQAALRQELGLVELVYRFGAADARFVPMLALGGGVYHMAVQGSARSPFEGHSLTSWSALVGGGVGGALRLGRHAALLLDVQALLAQPAPVVQIDEERAGALGRPALLACFGLVASL